MANKAEARRRVRIAAKAEMGHRGWNIQQLADETGLTRDTLSDFLEGTRWPQQRTLGAIERGLGWNPGAIAEVLEGGEPPSVGGVSQDPSQTDDTLLFRRPDGLTDAEWQKLQEDQRGYWEWQIEKASRER